ncbi:hypothetical protein [Acinetobacter indicus]|uniref:hypothetical protein n=1 Tax=Acinetobacter indicus TaxID=756892 RepID=UPI00144408EB|nr:hypothetical protein [Acinetobacter indicus]
MHSKQLGMAVCMGLLMSSAWAEPPLQPGDTLESLSQVRIITTLQPAVSAEEAAQVALIDTIEEEQSEQSTEMAVSQEDALVAEIDPVEGV